MLAWLLDHDHNTIAKGKRGVGSGLNACSLVTRALPHPPLAARLTAGCPEGVQRTVEDSVSIAGLALNLLMHSDLPRHCELEPDRELLWRSRFMLEPGLTLDLDGKNPKPESLCKL